MNYDDLIETLTEAKIDLTIDSLGRAIVQVYGETEAMALVRSVDRYI